MIFLILAIVGIQSESRGEGSHAENVKKKYQIHHEQFNLRWDPRGVCLSYDEKISMVPCDGYDQKQKFLIVETASELVYHSHGEVNQKESDKNFKMLIVHAESKVNISNPKPYRICKRNCKGQSISSLRKVHSKPHYVGFDCVSVLGKSSNGTPGS